MYEILKDDKYFYISGLIAFVIILLIGNYSIYSYIIIGIWFGFWMSAKLMKQKIEKIMNKSEDENDFYKKMEEYL